MMTTDLAIGTTLEERRTTLGLSLDEIAAKTRIRREYLAALEAEDYTKLPGTTFVTGFLRNYADFLGLDADRMVAAYISQRDASATDSVPPPRQEVLPRWRIHFVVVVLSALLLVGYWFFLSEQISSLQIPTAPPPADTLPAPELSPPVAPAALPMKVAKPEQALPIKISLARRGVLQLSATGATQIVLTIDNRPQQRYNLSQGSRLRWEINTQATVHITDPAQVKLQLNQEPILLQGNHDIIFFRPAN
ncbi:MAG: helix-turn-helix transcriptional regulator [Desulfuromonadales bacterium]|nr:helix-turn-helix transcriptional regulator [Desulfuromonadales bacterium]